MSQYSNQAYNNSILANKEGVVVPQTAQLNAEAQAAFVAAGNSPAAQGIPGNHPAARGMGGYSACGGNEAQEQQHRQQQLLLAQAQAAAEQRNRAIHAARARAIAQRQEEDELLVRLLLQRRQQAAALGMAGHNAGMLQDPSLAAAQIHGAPGLAFSAPATLGLAPGLAPNPGSAALWAAYGNAGLANVNATRLQAQQELHMMDRNALFLEEARARQGLRTLAYIHPHTGFTMPASSAGSAGLAALQGFRYQDGGSEGLHGGLLDDHQYPSSAVSSAIQQQHQHQQQVISATNLTAASRFPAVGQNLSANPPSVAAPSSEDGEDAEDLVAEKKARKPRTSDMPRRPYSAYNLFFADEKDRLMRELETEQGCSVSDEASHRNGERNETAAMVLLGNTNRSGPKPRKKSKVKCRDMAKTIGARWQSLTEENRKYYQKLADEDAVRQKEAMDDYRNKYGVDALDQSACSADIDDLEDNMDNSTDPHAKDPSAPKKPGSAFLLFSNGRRKEIKRSHPELTNAELSKVLSKLWKEAPEEVREHYLEKSRELGRHYKVEMAQWRKKVAEEKKLKRTAGLPAEGENYKPTACPKEDEKEMDATETPAEAVASFAAAAAVDKDANIENATPEAGRDPDVPKPPETAFQAFVNKRRKGLKLQYPFAIEEEMSRMLSKTWRKCPQIIREKYLAEAEVRVEQYQNALARHQKSRGNKNKPEEHTEDERDVGDVPEFVDYNVTRDEEGSEDDGSIQGDFPPISVKQVRATSISGQIYALFKKSDWDALTLATRVVDLCRIFDWKELATATFDCYGQRRLQNVLDMGRIVNRAEAIEMIRSKIPASKVDEQRSELVSDFIVSLESNPFPKEMADEDDDPFLSIENVGILIRVVAEAANEEQFRQIERWAAKAPPAHSLSLYELLRVVESSASPVEAIHPKALRNLLKSLGSRHKDVKIEDLKEEREELIEATQGCQPRFSWSMPKADTESAALTSFLRSDTKGPVTVVVGGGADFSRKLASKCKTDSNLDSRTYLKLGYSANMEPTAKVGRHASITVTKTKDYYFAQVKDYREKMVKLRNVCLELRELGENVVVLGTAENAPVDMEDEATASENEEIGSEKNKDKDEEEKFQQQEVAKKKEASPAAKSEDTATSADEETASEAELDVEDEEDDEEPSQSKAPFMSAEEPQATKQDTFLMRKRSLPLAAASDTTKSEGGSNRESKKKKSLASEAMSGRFKTRHSAASSDSEASA